MIVVAASVTLAIAAAIAGWHVGYHTRSSEVIHELQLERDLRRRKAKR